MVENVETFYKPTAITDIFKNRRGRWNMVSVWQAIDLGTLTTIDLFVTNPSYKPVEEFQIIDFVEEKTEEAISLENFYNNGEVTDEYTEQLLDNLETSAAAPTKAIDKIKEAFQDIERVKEENRKKDWSDFGI